MTGPASDGDPRRRAPLWRRVWNRVWFGLGPPRWRERHHIFAFEPGSTPPPAPPGLRVERFTAPDAVPLPVVDLVRRHGGDRAVEANVRELRDHALYWVAFLEAAPVAAYFSRCGARMARWFVPLEPDDLVLFRGWTSPEHRGRGISPCLMRRILETELRPGSRAFVDCSIYNAPSIRGIEKAGFRRIATARPLSRGEVLP